MKSLSEGGEYTITDEMKAQLVDFMVISGSEDECSAAIRYLHKTAI